VSPAPAAALVVAAVLLWLPAPPRHRPTVRSRGSLRSPVVTRAVLPAVAGLGAGVLVGGLLGAAVGLGCAVAVRVGLPLLETGAQRSRREAVERQAPLLLDLVAACLASGAPLDASVRAAAMAVGAPVADLVIPALEAVRLGAEADRAWATVGQCPPLAGFARAVVRAVESGAPLSDVLPRLADRARSSRRATAETRVRAAGVRLTAPLGLAFLPAFVLLGVVPVVAAWVGALL
jgi:Flp pilus assembly protein TadB